MLEFIICDCIEKLFILFYVNHPLFIHDHFLGMVGHQMKSDSGVKY